MLGKKATKFKALSLYGKHVRRCGGHKWEGKCALPGEVCIEQHAEVSRGRSKTGTSLKEKKDYWYEGLNIKLRE